jgi:oligopeptide transport system ATP-binding protein
VTTLTRPDPEAARPRSDALLEVRNLHVDFDYGTAGLVRAVDGISYSLNRGEVLGIVGESGSGKSVSALSLLRLLPTPPARVSGAAIFDGQDLLGIPERALQDLRGNRIAMVFQDATTALNPVLTIGRQIGEVLRLHRGLAPAAARARTIELLSKMGIPAASQRVDDYPYQFSGGMRQRAMIAMAIACEPLLLIADEATTALDVTIQAQILELLRNLQADIAMSMIMITHDLGVVASMCDRVNVMYAGRIVETGQVREIFRDAHMPYTWGLLDSLPRIDAARGRLRTIDGLPPDLSDLGERCRFAPRCSYARQTCREAEPELLELGEPGHLSRCWGTQSNGWVTRP